MKINLQRSPTKFNNPSSFLRLTLQCSKTIVGTHPSINTLFLTCAAKSQIPIHNVTNSLKQTLTTVQDMKILTWNDPGPLVLEPKPRRPQHLPTRFQKLLSDLRPQRIQLGAGKEEELGVASLLLGHLQLGEAEERDEGPASAIGVGGEGREAMGGGGGAGGRGAIEKVEDAEADGGGARGDDDAEEGGFGVGEFGGKVELVGGGEEVEEEGKGEEREGGDEAFGGKAVDVAGGGAATGRRWSL